MKAIKELQYNFFLPMRQSLFYFQRCWKILLAHGLKPLTRDTKSDVNCLQMFFTTNDNCIQMFFMRRNENDALSQPSYHIIVTVRFKISIFPIIGKKNNQSSVFDADQEIPILGSRDNAGNSVNLVSGISCLPSGWDFSVCIGD